MNQSLPSDPNVGHLKKQAKALLASCREGNPAAHRRLSENHPRYAEQSNDPGKAALQEAQLVVAREYGFSSWPQLIRSLRGEATRREEVDTKILLYTNGRSSIDLLTAANVPGQKLEWLEALHDGPVPLTESREALYRIRARHFADLGWTSVEGALDGFRKRDEPLLQSGDYDRLELWFEHDLYDQLQLVQILDYLAELSDWKGKTWLYQFDTYLGYLKPEQVAAHRPDPVEVTAAHIALGRAAWAAFRGQSPLGIQALAREGAAKLPFLSSALMRLCEEFPAADTGLGRTEAEILAAVSGGLHRPGEIMRYYQQREEAWFMGDSSFFALLRRLTQGPLPILRTESGEPFRVPGEIGYTDAFRNQRIQLTDSGERLLRGESDWLIALPSPYWIGGVRIDGPAAPRWHRGDRGFV